MLRLQNAELDFQSKHTELVMKCTWKLIKAIPQMLQEKSLEIAPLLLDVHEFLMAYPPLEWKRRISLQVPQADMPLRTVKTILSMILSAVGNDFASHATLIHDQEGSHALQYLRQMSESGDKKKSPPPQKSVQIKHPLPMPVPERLSIDQIKEKLASIFEKISNKEQTKTGIQELHQFQKSHPYAQDLIEERLLQTGAYFQGYIRRGLAHLDEDVEMVPETRSVELPRLEQVTPAPLLDRIPSQTMDRSLAVADLKERLAKMKMSMSSK